MFHPSMIILRVFLALLFLFISTKLLTKRSLAHLTYFDYIATTTLGTIAGNLAFNIKINIWVFILSMGLITSIIMVISYVSLKYKPFGKFLAGEPTKLIQNGKILESNLSKLSYSYNYLNQQLRQKNVFDINKVEFAILEPSGKLSVQLKSEHRPLTPKDLHLPISFEGLAAEIILAGKILEINLEKNNVTQEWLYQELHKRGIHNIKEVAFAALSSNGNLYVDIDSYHDEY